MSDPNNTTAPAAPTFGGPGQRWRTVRALQLLGASHAAHESGNAGMFDELLNQAYRECGIDTVTALSGGMTIGEVPKPGDPGWREYLADQITALQLSGEGLPLTGAQLHEIFGAEGGLEGDSRGWHEQGVTGVQTWDRLDIYAADGDHVGYVALNDRHQLTGPYNAVVRRRPLRGAPYPHNPDATSRGPAFPAGYRFVPPDPKQGAVGERQRWNPSGEGN